MESDARWREYQRWRAIGESGSCFLPHRVPFVKCPKNPRTNTKDPIHSALLRAFLGGPFVMCVQERASDRYAILERALFGRE